MTTRDERRQISHFVRRADSAFFADDKKLSTLEAWLCFAGRSPGAARIWKHRLAGVKQEDLAGILSNVPPQRMTDVCRQFALSLLTENQRRLLSEDRT